MTQTNSQAAQLAAAVASGATVRRLGHTFRPMTNHDFMGFGGADVGSMICYCDDTILVLSPGGDVSEITADPKDELATRENLWTAAVVL